MYKYGAKSTARKNTLHPKLQAICDELIQVMDVTIVSGHRGESEQNELYRAGRSKKLYPNSKHNRMPSRGVDVAPYDKAMRGVNWHDEKKFYYMDGIVRGIAHELGINIRGGWDWDSDNDFEDQTFDDLAHFELED
jgi:hypothetical protein